MLASDVALHLNVGADLRRFAVGTGSYHAEVGHHPRRVMLENVAVVHPLARPVVGDPRDAHAPACRHVDRVLPRSKRWRGAIALDDLEEEPVQVERGSIVLPFMMSQTCAIRRLVQPHEGVVMMSNTPRWSWAPPRS